jgi:hypothetical protein
VISQGVGVLPCPCSHTGSQAASASQQLLPAHKAWLNQVRRWDRERQGAASGPSLCSDTQVVTSPAPDVATPPYASA